MYAYYFSNIFIFLKKKLKRKNWGFWGGGGGNGCTLCMKNTLINNKLQINHY